MHCCPAVFGGQLVQIPQGTLRLAEARMWPLVIADAQLGKEVPSPPKKKWAGGNLPAVLPDKPGKQHQAWLMKKGPAHIYEPFIVRLD